MSTLAKFQSGSGIDVGEQIVLILNPKAFQDFDPCVYPYRKLRPLQYLRQCWNDGKLYFPGSLVSVNRPVNHNLFVGYFDHSWNDLTPVKKLLSELGKNHSETNFNLVIGKGDYHCTEEFVAEIPNNVHVWMNNVQFERSNLHFLPMGRDFRSVSVFKDQRPSAEKQQLCYCNFSINTHSIRPKVYEMVKDKPFVKCEHMGQFRNYGISRKQFFHELSTSKFCVCPRGNAYDTFRMWDSMYVGTIPIVVKEAYFHDLLDDMPILFLESYEQFAELDEDFLEQTYQQMQNRTYNYAKLRMKNWLPGGELA